MTLSSKYKVQTFESVNELNKAAAAFIVNLSIESIAEKGRFSMVLSGGKTPEKLYSLLANPGYRSRVDWKNVHVFWGDERCVALNDKQNNAHQAMTVFLNKVPIPPENIHRIPVNLIPAEAASEYEKEINRYFKDHTPAFDLILLGLGSDGHTASLFPDTKVLQEKIPGIKTIHAEDQNFARITMTAPLINLAHRILVLVTGMDKSGIIERVFSTDNKYPVHLIMPVMGDLQWFIDKEAANYLNDKNS